jgi:hypothetical protein
MLIKMKKKKKEERAYGEGEVLVGNLAFMRPAGPP